MAFIARLTRKNCLDVYQQEYMPAQLELKRPWCMEYLNCHVWVIILPVITYIGPLIIVC